MLFVENRIEAFVPQINSFAEAKIEESLGGRLKLSIGWLEGGIIHPVALNDIKIKDESKGAVLPFLVINRIKTGYRMWDIIARGKSGSVLSKVLPGGSYIDMSFVTKDKRMSGFARVENKDDELRFKGYLNLTGTSRKIDFSGKVYGDSFDIDLKFREGALLFRGRFLDDGSIAGDMKVDHIKAGGFDIACNAKTKNTISYIDSEHKRIRIDGEFDTDALVLNGNPFLGMKASYNVADGVFTLVSLKMADSFALRGQISTKKPYDTDMVLTVNNVSISWLVSNLGASSSPSPITGTMNGKFEFKGPLGDIGSKCDFTIRKGTIVSMDFDYLSASLKGEGPLMRIEDSRVTRPSGYFVLAGDMDLRRIGRSSLFENIKLVSDDRAINWDDIATTRVQDVSEISMKKKLNDDISLDFRKFVPEGKIDESVRDKDNFQVGYKLNSTESLKMMMGTDNDFFGLEHKDKF